MMGRLTHDQEQFLYSFRLDEAVPDDHPVREIAAVLDLSWVHSELAPYYSRLGRPSIDPVLMIPDAHRRLRVCDPIGASAVP
jgi:transposase